MLGKRLSEVSGALEKIDVERFVRHSREDREGDSSGREATVSTLPPYYMPLSMKD